MALYNDVRPQMLSQIKGQADVVKIVKQSVAKENLPNAALFIGTRGTGKTTVARILAKMVNCENPQEDGEPCCRCDSCLSIQNGTSMDVMELDAASNNSVEDVRKLIGLLEYKTMGLKKVIILDEVHMLSTGAFNALLKVLEEPPKDVLFILCTTEAHKVPATILSRCRKFQFHSLGIEEIKEKLKEICQKYSVEAEEEALTLVAKAGNGSMRDTESIFESFLNESVITADRVRSVLGLSSMDKIFTIIKAIHNADIQLAKVALDDATSKGENLTVLLEDLITAFLDMASIRLGGDISDVHPELAELALDFTENRLFELIAGCREIYEAKPSNLSVAFLSMLISLMVTESTVTKLEKEVGEVRAMLLAGTLSSVPVPSEEYAAEYIQEETEMEQIANEPSDLEDFEPLSEPSPFDEEEQVLEPSVNSAETTSGPQVDPETLAVLAAAGFVVDTEDTDERTVAESPEKEPAVKEDTSTKDYFSEFEALFHM